MTLLNPLRLDFFTLPGKLPAHVHVTADVLAQRQACADLVAQAHDDAERIQADAAALLDRAKQDAEAIRYHAHQRATQDIESLRHEAQQSAAADAVQWLCAEQDLEQAIARDVSRRWRHLTARALQEIIGTHDQTELLIRRVERKVDALLSRGQITVYVPPTALAAATRRIAQMAHVSVMADEQLAEGQARLENHLLHVHIDLAVLQNELLTQLAGETWKQAHV